MEGALEETLEGSVAGARWRCKLVGDVAGWSGPKDVYFCIGGFQLFRFTVTENQIGELDS